MRPDVAQASDRMAAAARREGGVDLIVNSGCRSDAEQAELLEPRRGRTEAIAPSPRKSRWSGAPLRHLRRPAHTGAAVGAVRARPTVFPSFGVIHRYAWEPWPYETA